MIEGNAYICIWAMAGIQHRWAGGVARWTIRMIRVRVYMCVVYEKEQREDGGRAGAHIAWLVVLYMRWRAMICWQRPTPPALGYPRTADGCQRVAVVACAFGNVYSIAYGSIYTELIQSATWGLLITRNKQCQWHWTRQRTRPLPPHDGPLSSRVALRREGL